MQNAKPFPEILLMTPGKDWLQLDSKATCFPAPLPSSLCPPHSSSDSGQCSWTVVCVSVLSLAIAVPGGFPSTGCCEHTVGPADCEMGGGQPRLGCQGCVPVARPLLAPSSPLSPGTACWYLRILPTVPQPCDRVVPHPSLSLGQSRCPG